MASGNLLQLAYIPMHLYELQNLSFADKQMWVNAQWVTPAFPNPFPILSDNVEKKTNQVVQEKEEVFDKRGMEPQVKAAHQYL